jgi:hypothetical protein
MKIVLTLAALSGVGTLVVCAQEGSKPAEVLTIYREVIKEGRNAAHEKVEADYAATFRKANFPAHCVALTAMSGSNEVWFLQPAPSFAVAEEWDQAGEKEPMKSALGMQRARRRAPRRLHDALGRSPSGLELPSREVQSGEGALHDRHHVPHETRA